MGPNWRELWSNWILSILWWPFWIKWWFIPAKRLIISIQHHQFPVVTNLMYHDITKKCKFLLMSCGTNTGDGRQLLEFFFHAVVGLKKINLLSFSIGSYSSIDWSGFD